MRLSSKFVFALVFVFLLNAFNDVFAAQIAAVKGKQVLIMGDNLEQGALYFAVENGKKKGIVKILNIKGRKALATLLKGSAAKGNNLVFRPKKSKTGTTTASKTQAPKSNAKNYDKYSEESSSKFDNSSDYRKSGSGKQYSLGGMIVYQQNSSSVTFSDNSTDSLSGTGIGFKAFGDYPFSDHINIRGEFGTVPFTAEGTNKCTGICVMNISYIGASLMARYMLGSSTDKTRFWGGAGAALIFPTGTGDTNAVNADDVGSTLIFNLGGGFDYNINNKYYIPVAAEYSLFPPNDEVSANMIMLKAGLGMRL
jgi:outer membrane protein W